MRRSEPAETTARSSVPLVVDLDGTLLRGDVLHESALKLVKEAPGLAFALPFWLLQGKAQVKRRIADRVDLDVALLPYADDFLEWLRTERERGRELVLCTASDEKYARDVAAHLGLFDAVMASDGHTNLSGERKAAALVERFGRGRFDYAGNSLADGAVWAEARHAIVVGARPGARAAAARVSVVEREFSAPGGDLMRWIKAFRLHQWAKNALVFLPLLGAHRIFEAELVVRALLAFVAFGLCASSVYILNDLMDLESDRSHPRKRLRPFASGALPATAGLALSGTAWALAFAIAFMVRLEFVGWLFVYWCVTMAYTLLLKRKVLVDALTLAGLYTLRILAGGAAVDIDPGFWLLAFSLFIFLSLAFVKRYAEMETLFSQGREATRGRDYVAKDLPLVETLGIVSGFASVLVLALYINGDSISRLYVHRQVVWLTVPILLYWVSRVWVKAHRGEMHDDPVVFALRDRLSQMSIGLFILVMWVAATPW